MPWESPTAFYSNLVVVVVGSSSTMIIVEQEIDISQCTFWDYFSHVGSTVTASSTPSFNYNLPHKPHDHNSEVLSVMRLLVRVSWTSWLLLNGGSACLDLPGLV